MCVDRKAPKKRRVGVVQLAYDFGKKDGEQKKLSGGGRVAARLVRFDKKTTTGECRRVEHALSHVRAGHPWALVR
jgi:hypothetical protein